MPRAAKEQALRRTDEILDACAELYATSSFHDVTIKDIAAATSFSRPSIYNYFHTIEEIFLGLLQREYERWADDLEALRDQEGELSCEGLASAIAHTLDKRTTLLRIQATNLHEIEDNCRLERLTDFKVSMVRVFDAFDGCIRRYLPEKTDEDLLKLRYAFFPFLYGAYPFSEPSEKQKAAMDAAGMVHPQITLYELIYGCLLKLLQ